MRLEVEERCLAVYLTPRTQYLGPTTLLFSQLVFISQLVSSRRWFHSPRRVCRSGYLFRRARQQLAHFLVSRLPEVGVP